MRLTLVKGCRINCPLYHSSMDGMECHHPYVKHKVYENMLPRHGVNVPEDCPLRHTKVVHTIKLGVN